MTGAQAAGLPHPRSRQRGCLCSQGTAGRGPARRGARALRGAGGSPSAAGGQDCVSLSARFGGGGRGGAGRAREGVFAPVVVPRRAAVRGLVHAHPDQRVPRPDQGADAARAVAGADAGVAARQRDFTERVAGARTVARGSAARRANGGRSWRPRWRGCRSGSDRCSC